MIGHRVGGTKAWLRDATIAKRMKVLNGMIELLLMQYYVSHSLLFSTSTVSSLRSSIFVGVDF